VTVAVPKLKVRQAIAIVYWTNRHRLLHQIDVTKVSPVGSGDQLCPHDHGLRPHWWRM